MLGLVLVAALLAAGCAAEGSNAAGGTAPEGGAAAQQLSFSAQTVSGQKFSGQSVADGPTVLWFWAAWCAICDREAEGVARVAEDSPGDVTFVGVAARSDVPAMQRFVRSNGIGSFTQIADVNGSVWQRFGVTRQPAYAFISQDGTVETVQGTLSEKELAGRVNQLVES